MIAYIFRREIGVWIECWPVAIAVGEHVRHLFETWQWMCEIWRGEILVFVHDWWLITRSCRWEWRRCEWIRHDNGRNAVAVRIGVCRWFRRTFERSCWRHAIKKCCSSRMKTILVRSRFFLSSLGLSVCPLLRRHFFFFLFSGHISEKKRTHTHTHTHKNASLLFQENRFRNESRPHGVSSFLFVIYVSVQIERK